MKRCLLIFAYVFGVLLYVTLLLVCASVGMRYDARAETPLTVILRLALVAHGAASFAALVNMRYHVLRTRRLFGAWFARATTKKSAALRRPATLMAMAPSRYQLAAHAVHALVLVPATQASAFGSGFIHDSEQFAAVWLAAVFFSTALATASVLRHTTRTVYVTQSVSLYVLAAVAAIAGLVHRTRTTPYPVAFDMVCAVLLLCSAVHSAFDVQVGVYDTFEYIRARAQFYMKAAGIVGADEVAAEEDEYDNAEYVDAVFFSAALGGEQGAAASRRKRQRSRAKFTIDTES